MAHITILLSANTFGLIYFQSKLLFASRTVLVTNFKIKWPVCTPPKLVMFPGLPWLSVDYKLVGFIMNKIGYPVKSDRHIFPTIINICLFTGWQSYANYTTAMVIHFKLNCPVGYLQLHFCRAHFPLRLVYILLFEHYF